MRWNESVRIGRQNPVEAGEKRLPGTEEPVIVSEPLVPLLQAVHVPHTPRGVYHIAAEHDPPSVHIDHIGNAAIRMPGCGKNADLRPVPLEAIAVFHRVCHGNGFGQRPWLRMVVIEMPAMALIIPEGFGGIEQSSFGGRNTDPQAFEMAAQQTAGLVTVMVGEEHTIDLVHAEFTQRLPHGAVAIVDEEGVVLVLQDPDLNAFRTIEVCDEPFADASHTPPMISTAKGSAGGACTMTA